MAILNVRKVTVFPVTPVANTIYVKQNAGTTFELGVTNSTGVLHTYDVVNGFTKGNLVQGAGITLTGTLTNRLVGTGDITIASTGVSGSGVAGQVTYWNGTNSQTGKASFTFDDLTDRLLITGAATTSGITLGTSAVTDTPNIRFITSTNHWNIDNQNGALRFFTEPTYGTGGTLWWSMLATGVLQANAAQTIQTSSGVLTLQPNGTAATTGINATANLNFYSGTGTGVIKNTVNTGAIAISGGNITSDGANVTLYGSAHATTPNYFLFRTGATTQFTIDSSVVDIPTNYLQARGGITNTISGASPLSIGPILTYTLTDGGTGYVDGTYVNVTLTAVVSQAYALFDITVVGGVVTIATLKHAGRRYVTGSTHTIANTLLGGSGSGLIITVNTVQGAEIYLANASGSTIRLERFDSTAEINDVLGQILFSNLDSTIFGGGDRAAIVARSVNINGGGYIDFEAAPAGGGSTSTDRVVTMRAYSNSVRFQDGTAAIPSIGFINDNNTGLYSAGADILGISTAGVLRWSFTADGSFQGNVVGTNVLTTADTTRINGLGIAGNRTTYYLTNSHATGEIVIGNNGLHNVNRIAVFGPTGTVLSILSAATVDTDKFLVADGNTIKYRTGAQILGDIGAQPTGNYVTLDTTQTITGAKTFTSAITYSGTGLSWLTFGNTLVNGSLRYINNTSGDNILLITKTSATISTYDVRVFGSSTATNFIKTGGTALQFLKADGSVDSTVYENSLNKQNSMVLDGTGVKYPTVDAVNLQVNNVARTLASTGFVDPTDTFSLYKVDNNTLGINASIYGILFKQKLRTPPFAPSDAIIYLTARTVPLSAIGLTGTGTAVKYVGYRQSDDAIIFADTSFIQSPSVAQLGVVMVKFSGGVTSFVDDDRHVLTIPSIAGYSNLETSASGLKAQMSITANPGTLSHGNSAGKLIGISVAWGTSNNDILLINSAVTTSFTRLHPGNAFTDVPPPFVTVMDPARYWNGTALVSISGSPNQATIQRLLLTTRGTFVWQYGEKVHSNLIAAQNNILQETFSTVLPEGTFAEVGRMAITVNCTDLASSSAQYYPTGGSGGGSGINSSSVLWGSILGQIDDQIDLKTKLDAKANAAILINTTLPLQGGGDLSANRTLSITQAGTSSNGYLSSTDWNTFNSKQVAGSFLSTLSSSPQTVTGVSVDFNALPIGAYIQQVNTASTTNFPIGFTGGVLLSSVQVAGTDFGAQMIMGRNNSSWFIRGVNSGVYSSWEKIGTQEWSNSNLVTLTTTQTITGIKTFDNRLVYSANNIVENQFVNAANGLISFYDVTQFVDNGTTLTGNIKISLPDTGASNSSIMTLLKIHIYTFNTSDPIELMISFFNATAMNYFNVAIIYGNASFITQARIGREGTRAVIWIDHNLATWNYVKVILKEATYSHLSVNSAVWKDKANYAITVTTVETGYTNVLTQARTAFKHDAQLVDLANAQTITGAKTFNNNIFLAGATSNRIEYSSTGLGAPTYTTRSIGTKIVLYPALTASTADFAIGMEASAIWNSVSASTQSFKWYAGTSLIAVLTGTGQLHIGTTIGTDTLDVNGTARIRTIANYGSAPAEVLVPGPTGVVSSRTLTEFKADLGLTSAINGTGVAGEVTYWNGTNTVTGSVGFAFAITSGSRELTVGTSSVSGTHKVDVRGGGSGMFYGYFLGGEASIVRNTTASSKLFIGSDGVSTLTQSIAFYTNAITRWSILSSGILESTGAQTIQTSTGILTLQANGGNILVGTTASAGSTTPLSFSLGGTFGTNTPGDINNIKLSVFESGVNKYGFGVSSNLFEIRSGTGAAIGFFVNSGVEAWRMLSSGILQSNGAQTIQTSTGILTLATLAGNGNINISPNGTGTVNTTKELIVQTIGTNVAPSTDHLRVNGYGLLANRSALYITNYLSTGNIIIGNNGIHNANAIATFGTTGTTLNILSAAATNPDKFLVSDAGVVKYRTGAQLAADLGFTSSSFQRDVFGYVASNVFVISRSTPNAMFVFLNGQKLQFTSDWTIAGTSVTVTTPLVVGDEISIEYFYAAPATGLSGGGSANILARWGGTSELESSIIQDNGTQVTVGGELSITTVAAATIDTDKFLVSDSGVLKYRTGAQMLTDIGAQATGNYVTTDTAQSITAIKTFTVQIVSTSPNSTTTGAGQIYLNGATGNRIDFAAVGFAAPTFTTRSVGTKLTIYPVLSASTADYAIGMETNNMWFTTTTTTTGFKFYGGTTLAASLTGAGALTLSSIAAATTNTDKFLVSDAGVIKHRTALQLASDIGVMATFSKGNSATAVAFNWNDGYIQKVTMTGNATFTFSNPKSGATYQVIITQDATGGRAITWPTIKWKGGGAPVLTGTANSTDIVTMTYDGTSYFGVFTGDLK